MALSSDEVIKREVVDQIGDVGDLKLRIFRESSREDQKLFSQGGLTFGVSGVSYGSCDACWYVEENWMDGFDGNIIDKRPVIALEGTDARNRRSSGNAQYQRFHHVLGAVKNGIVGIYYLKLGEFKIQEDLYAMAYFASKIERGKYLITEDLSFVKKLLELHENKEKFDKCIEEYLETMFAVFRSKFKLKYHESWEEFASKRSTIIDDNFVIKYSARMKRNFTDGSQRAGHIAVGEMYLSKYYFPQKKLFYLLPRMSKEDLRSLDEHKKVDKEWYLLRNEPDVFIKTVDDIENLEPHIKEQLMSVKDAPLLRDPASSKIYKESIKKIADGLRKRKYSIKGS